MSEGDAWRQMDHDRQKYWYNAVTGVSQWHAPEARPGAAAPDLVATFAAILGKSQRARPAQPAARAAAAAGAQPAESDDSVILVSETHVVTTTGTWVRVDRYGRVPVRPYWRNTSTGEAQANKPLGAHAKLRAAPATGFTSRAQQRASRSRGVVKWYDGSRKFGFIVPDDGSEDIFFHERDIPPECDGDLVPGTALEYAVIGHRGNDRPKALNIELLDG
ncbi:hypothetical protein M885DRAFT_526889 [Pelagophyceae sp. CCMP2097]|nr:hypothetical protein M885DRAFT_526889 [Pelagophyceae sp. CCMP2097]